MWSERRIAPWSRTESLNSCTSRLFKSLANTCRSAPSPSAVRCALFLSVFSLSAWRCWCWWSTCDNVAVTVQFQWQKKVLERLDHSYGVVPLHIRRWRRPSTLQNTTPWFRLSILAVGPHSVHCFLCGLFFHYVDLNNSANCANAVAFKGKPKAEQTHVCSSWCLTASPDSDTILIAFHSSICQMKLNVNASIGSAFRGNPCCSHFIQVAILLRQFFWSSTSGLTRRWHRSFSLRNELEILNLVTSFGPE